MNYNRQLKMFYNKKEILRNMVIGYDEKDVMQILNTKFGSFIELPMDKILVLNQDGIEYEKIVSEWISYFGRGLILEKELV